MHRYAPIVCLGLLGCDPLDPAEPAEAAAEATDERKTNQRLCSESKFEAQQPWVPGHEFVPGFADLPSNSEACAALAKDADADGLTEGQELCDAKLNGPQGLPPGASHFVTYAVEDGVACGCTCGVRSTCAYPGKHATYDAVGAGSFAEPFEIYTAEQLWDLAHEPDGWSQSFVQCADIDLAAFYSAARPYFVIPELSGDYDGQNRRISGFTYDVDGGLHSPPPVLANDGVTVVRADDRRLGLFGVVTGNVSRLTLDAGLVRAEPAQNSAEAGILAGKISGEAFQIRVSGVVETGDIFSYGGGISGLLLGRATDFTVDAQVVGDHAGGAFGLCWGSAMIRGEVEADVEGSFTAGGVCGWAGGIARSLRASGSMIGPPVPGGGTAGGVFGQWNGDAANVHADATVQATNAGGITANLTGSLSRSSAAGLVIGSYAGGLVGRAIPAGASITNSFATATVIGVTSNFPGVHAAGGLIGWVYDQDGPAAVTISNSYASGTVYAVERGGSFIGAADSLIPITSSFGTGKVSGGIPLPFGQVNGGVDPTNRYNKDVNPVVPGQGTPASLAAGVFSDPNANFGYSWPTGSGGWTFTPGQLPRLTDAP